VRRVAQPPSAEARSQTHAFIFTIAAAVTAIGIAPLDPSSLAAGTVFVALVAAVAIAIPVERATSIEPAAALRQGN